jgi:hypothetical protein
VENWELAVRLVVLSGLPVVLLFLLGYWLRGRTGEAGVKARLAHNAGGTQPDSEFLPDQTSKPRCWQVLACSMERRSTCPAYERMYLPCWLANQLAHGELKRECSACIFYDLRKAA